MSRSVHPRVMAVGDFLPHLTLVAPGAEAPVALRGWGRDATVLVRVHDAWCEGCRRYLAELAPAAPELRAWDGRVIVVVPGAGAEGEALREVVAGPFAIASDPRDEAPLAGGAGVVIADRFGQVYHVCGLRSGHAFPAPREVEEWLRFLATQCPE